jgi:hypothetical protein
MNNLKIQIQGVQPKTFTIEVPEKWTEMKPKQIESAASYLFSFKQDRLIAQQRMLVDLLGLNRKDMHEVMGMLTDIEQDVSVMDLYPFLNWVNNIFFFDKDLYVPAKPHKEIGEEYENIGLKQYFFIEHLYRSYQKERTEINMQLVLAAIYPIDDFDNHKIEEGAKAIKLMDIEVRQALLLNFIGLRTQFSRDHPTFFPEVDKPEKGEEKKEEPEEHNYFEIYQNLLFDLPNEKFGGIEKIGKTPVTLVFNYLAKEKRNIKTN